MSQRQTDPSALPRSLSDVSPASSSGNPRYQVLHRTCFEYAETVRHSNNTLHLEPRKFSMQRTLSAFIRVLPATRLRQSIDLFQNPTHYFEIPEPHDALEIESRIRVENLPLEVPEHARTACEEDYLDEDREFIWPFLQPSHFVAASPEIWRQAIDLAWKVGPVYEQAMAFMHWIHAEFEYDGQSTAVHTKAVESFELRRGVCQDFAHVMIGMCRSQGVPARYASGYLYNGPRDTLVGSQASHAWVEIYLPEIGWLGFDPTNNTLADERFVKVAVGRDYQDVAPVVGTYRGTGLCRMYVDVNVSRLD